MIEKMKAHVLGGTDSYGRRIAKPRGRCKQCIAALVHEYYGDDIADAARFCTKGETIAREYGYRVRRYVAEEAVRSYIADRYPHERSRYELVPDR